MNTARLQRMLSDAVAFDWETHLSQPGLSAPPAVVAGLSWVEQGRVIGKLLTKEQALAAFQAILANENITFVNSNVAFDMLVAAQELAKQGVDVLPAIFAAYEAGRVFDPLIVEMLHHIALGMLGYDPRTKQKLKDPETGRDAYYSQAVVVDLVLDEKGAKVNDKFRKSYALLEPLIQHGAPDPFMHWPPEAKQYPVDDTNNALRSALAQAGHAPNIGTHDFSKNPTVCTRCRKRLEPGLDPKCVAVTVRENIHDAAIQAYTHWCMYLGSAWGLMVDPVRVAKLKYESLKDLAEDQKPFIELGIIRDTGAKAGTVNESVLKRMMAEAHGSKDPCPTCINTRHPAGRMKGQPAPGKVPSEATAGRTLVNCRACDGTGLHLVRQCPRTPSGEIAIGRDPCSESGHDILQSWAAHKEDAKILSSYVPFLELGILDDYRLIVPEGAPRDVVDQCLEKCLADIERAKALNLRITIPITLFPNVLLETNRTSYFGVIQLLPRNGGVRDCFIARPGMVFFSNDYGGLELCTWSQICIWMNIDSKMAKAINAGMNVHAMLGAKMAGIPYDELLRRIEAGDKQAKEYRGAAKWGNFGFMADMGPVRFVEQLRTQGQDTPHPTGPIIKNGIRLYRGQRLCILIGGSDRCGGPGNMLYEYNKKEIAPTCKKCIECAVWLKSQWRETWPEEKEFFRIIKKISDQGWQKHPISKRIRGGIGYSDGANGYFQELAAQGAKAALREVTREQWDRSYRPPDLHGSPSVLCDNSRTIVFAHDELIGECRLELGHECGERVSATMERKMAEYVPDVKVKAEPTLMPYWYKQAAMLRDPQTGRLIPWVPKQKAA